MLNQTKTLALLSVLSALMIFVSHALLGGTGGVVIGIAIAAMTNLGSWYFSDKIALAAYRAQPVSASEAPQLHAMVERLAQRARIPKPSVYIVPTPAANAFATGRDPHHAAVAVTQGLMNLLSTDELEGVIAHELSHVMNRDTLTQAVAATIAGAIAFLAQMAQFAMIFGGGSRDENGGNPLGLLVSVIVAPIAATVIQLGISRTREFAADAGAARLTGNPRALVSALQRLEQSARRMPMDGNPAFQPLLISGAGAKSWLGNLFSTHPSTQDRVANLLKVERELAA
ncbi:MAG: M48 family metalloprotease [Spirulina sp. SIO3F2]|nr:M48 family metalloprotease [Spirulina sp. SIO3F2]